MQVTAGQITRFVEVADQTGHWVTAVEVATEQGPLIGVLVAPANGGPGYLAFEPREDLQPAAGRAPADGSAAQVTPEQEFATQAQGGPPVPLPGGPLTSQQVPQQGALGGPPSPVDDPRGLRRSQPHR